MKYIDFYGVLGVSEVATPQEIRRAYRQQAKKYHPDTHPGDLAAEDMFRKLQEAYEVLSDREKRARFDQLSRHWNDYESFDDVLEDLQKETPPPDEDETIVQEQKAPFKRPRPNADALFEKNFADFYDTFFGKETENFWKQRGQKPTTPKETQKKTAETKTDTAADTGFSLEYTTQITLEEASKGTKRRIQIHEEVLKTIEVNIPAGVVEGSKVRVQRENDDFYLVIHLKPHETFTVKDNDLYCELDVMDYEALLGTRKTVPTLSGALQMRVPAGSQQGKVFRIRGHGLSTVNKKTTGDLFVNLCVGVSQDLTTEETSLIERFRDLRESAKK